MGIGIIPVAANGLPISASPGSPVDSQSSPFASLLGLIMAVNQSTTSVTQGVADAAADNGTGTTDQTVHSEKHAAESQVDAPGSAPLPGPATEPDLDKRRSQDASRGVPGLVPVVMFLQPGLEAAAADKLSSTPDQVVEALVSPPRGGGTSPLPGSAPPDHLAAGNKAQRPEDSSLQSRPACVEGELGPEFSLGTLTDNTITALVPGSELQTGSQRVSVTGESAAPPPTGQTPPLHENQSEKDRPFTRNSYNNLNTTVEASALEVRPELTSREQRVDRVVLARLQVAESAVAQPSGEPDAARAPVGRADQAQVPGAANRPGQAAHLITDAGQPSARGSTAPKVPGGARASTAPQTAVAAGEVAVPVQVKSEAVEVRPFAMAEFLGKQPQAAGEAQTAKSQSDLVPTLRRREANPSVPAGDKPTVSLQASVIRQIIDQPEPAAAGQEWTEAVRTQVRAAWDEVVESADLQERPGKAEITIKLKPETFGKVQVTVAVDDKGTVKAVLKPSDSRGARELAGLIPELKNALESRGVTQATVVIETNHWTTPNHNSQGQTAFGQGETPGSPYQQPHGQSRQENRHAPQSFREPVYGGANQEGTGFDYRV